MEPFRQAIGIAVTLVQDDINTDQIAPALGHGVDADYGKTLFKRQRFNEDGSEISSHVLNRPQYKNARILITGDNFGCGSSRESAVWALTGYGIQCVIARSFADIFRENCLRNGVLPVVLPPGAHAALSEMVENVDGAEPFTVDLEQQTIDCPGTTQFNFHIATSDRQALMKGLDDIGLTLEHQRRILAWENGMAERRPWLQTTARPK